MRARFLSLLVISLAIPAFAGAGASHRVLILGDSLTEGYGVPKEDSFPSVLEDELKTDGYTQTVIINGGIGGSTSASGLSRLKWGLKGKPDILVLALGANDALRGLKPAETEENLLAVIRLAKQSGLQVLLAGMKAPPNYGADFQKQFGKVFTDIAREQKIPLIPFLLQGVAADPSLNQDDEMHPNVAGYRKVAMTVKKYLEPLL